MEDQRPLRTNTISISSRTGLQDNATHVERTSLKSDIPRRALATPRTALETMWVMGDVTLIESKDAMLIRNPITPYKNSQRINNTVRGKGCAQ